MVVAFIPASAFADQNEGYESNIAAMAHKAKAVTETKAASSTNLADIAFVEEFYYTIGEGSPRPVTGLTIGYEDEDNNWEFKSLTLDVDYEMVRLESDEDWDEEEGSGQSETLNSLADIKSTGTYIYTIKACEGSGYTGQTEIWFEVVGDKNINLLGNLYVEPWKVKATSNGSEIKVYYWDKNKEEDVALVKGVDYKFLHYQYVNPKNDSSDEYSKIKCAGDWAYVIQGIGKYDGEAYLWFEVEKVKQSITNVTKSKTVSYSKLKKKAQSFNIKAKAKTKLTYKKVSGNKKISVSKSGKVTIKKNALKKGKTYSLKVKVTAASSGVYYGRTVTKTIKIKAK